MLLRACHIEDSPVLELLAPVSLNVVYFRYVGDGLHEEGIVSINMEGLNERCERSQSAFLVARTQLNKRFSSSPNCNWISVDKELKGC